MLLLTLAHYGEIFHRIIHHSCCESHLACVRCEAVDKPTGAPYGGELLSRLRAANFTDAQVLKSFRCTEQTGNCSLKQTFRQALALNEISIVLVEFQPSEVGYEYFFGN